MFAKNSDRPPDEAQVVEWFPPRRDRGPVTTTYIEVAPAARDTIGFIGSRPWWLWGVEHGVNEAGVAIGNETIFTTLDPRGAAPALTGMDLVRLGLERASAAKDAVQVITDLLERYGQGGSGHHGRERPYWSSFLVADPAHAFVVETSGRQWAAEEVASTRAISNRTTIPAFDAQHRHPRQPVADLVDPRWNASRAVLARTPVTADDVVAHLRSHAGGEAGWTVCMHVDGVEATTASVVGELTTADEPVRARFLLGSPCTSVYVPLRVGPMNASVAWDRFARLGPELRAELDALEAALLSDSTAAGRDPQWNDEAWRRVDAALTAFGL